MKRRGSRRVASGALWRSAQRLVGIGPLLPLIQNDLDITHAVAGLLGTIPMLLMRPSSPRQHVSGRIGGRPVSSLCLSTALIGVFGVVRAIAPGASG